jgi:Transglutaminase-like superfamily
MRFGLQSGCASPSSNFSPARSETIRSGDGGVADTIAKMKALVSGPQGIRSFTVRQYALDAVRGVERGQHEIDSIFDHVKRDIEFRGEAGEYLQSPEATIQLGAGDCDCISVLQAALLQSVGYQTRFKTIALPGSADELSHVYLEVWDKRIGDWFPLDPTVERAYPGWEPETIARSESYTSNSHDGLLALGAAIAVALLF